MLFMHQRSQDKYKGNQTFTNFNFKELSCTKFQPCPGDLETYPSSTACRISELADGTVIEQTVTPNDLCDADDLHMFLLGIARKYRVGDGEELF